MTLACQNGGWDCARQATIGTVGILGTLASSVAVARLYAAWRRTSFHSVNVFMVSMAGLQAFLSAIMFLFAGESPQLGIIIKWLRETQVLVTFFIYARTALQLTSRLALLRCALHPTTLMLALYISVTTIAALAETHLSCAHPGWLLLSISGVVLAVAFAVSSFFVMRALRSADAVRASFSDVMSGKQRAISERMHQIIVLLSVNAVSSLFQLALDSYLLSASQEDGECNSDSAGTGTQLVMVILRLISYSVPVWATLYVFYWVPRHQFDTSLDVVLTSADGQQDGTLHEDL